MGSHINKDGQFQSDKYPTCPSGKVPLSVNDPKAQPLLWAYAEGHTIDPEFADDLKQSLMRAGYMPRCICASIQHADPRRHFKGCPKRDPFHDVVPNPVRK